MSPVISVEHLSKTYRLGQIGTPSESTRGELPAPSRVTWKSGGRRTIGTPRIARIARRVKHQPRIYPEGYDVTNWANEKNNSRNLSNLWQKYFVEFEQFVASSLKKNSWQTIFSPGD